MSHIRSKKQKQERLVRKYLFPKGIDIGRMLSAARMPGYCSAEMQNSYLCERLLMAHTRLPTICVTKLKWRLLAF